MSRSIHLIYPYGPGIVAPQVIGRRLGEFLSQRNTVVQHDWDALGVIRPQPGDVLLGHPHPMPGTIFRRSFRNPRWGQRLVISPFNGDPGQVAFLDPFVRRADAYLAITGAWWFRNVGRTPMAHWAPRMVHLDLAIEPADYPQVKTQFAPPGRRRILYIGHSGWQKNVGYLSEIARARPQWDFGWIGSGASSDIPGVTALGMRDTASPETRRLIATYDLMLTVGRADANPMTVLEAMSWGLIPVCTPQSGYVDEPGIVNVPLDHVDGAVAELDRLQSASDAELLGLQRTNQRRIVEHFSWERFGRQVEAALRCDLPPLPRLAPKKRLQLARAVASSPYGPLRRPGWKLGEAALRKWARARWPG